MGFAEELFASLHLCVTEDTRRRKLFSFSQDNFYQALTRSVSSIESIDSDKMRFFSYELKMGLMVELPVFDVASRALMPFMEDLESKSSYFRRDFLLHWEEIEVLWMKAYF